MTPTVPDSVDSRRCRARTGFSLVELLVVLLVIGLIAMIAGSQINKAIRRAKVDSTADTIRNFIQEAGAQVPKQNLPVFVELGRVAVPAPGFYRLLAIADSSTNGQLDAPYNTAPVGAPGNVTTRDTIVAQYDVPSDIALSSVLGTTQIESALWSSNAADTSTRQLLCDFQSRTIDPANGRQIVGVATLSVSHVDMLRATGRLTPLINAQIRINPIWSARIVRTVQ
ncbi:MAG: prepilin-type N-terminal cleavage/methylation domain-containing protein [Thermoanaerobaculia bacterium]